MYTTSNLCGLLFSLHLKYYVKINVSVILINLKNNVVAKIKEKIKECKKMDFWKSMLKIYSVIEHHYAVRSYNIILAITGKPTDCEA